MPGSYPGRLMMMLAGSVMMLAICAAKHAG
jgi:hypothetical protein